MNASSGAAPFHAFGVAHLGAVAVIASLIALGAWRARSMPAERTLRVARVLGIALAVWYVVDSAVRVLVLRAPMSTALPFHFCGWAHMIAVYALVTRGPKALEVFVLLTLAGVLQSLVTPTPAEGFPSLEFVRYFAYHGLLVGSAVWALLALTPRFGWRSVVRSLLVLQAFETLTGVIDWLSGENFMYLRAPPPSPTLFDVLGPWPWYLASLELASAVFLAFFALVCGRVTAALRPSS